MSQKLPVNDFMRVKETYQFNEDFLKIYNEDSNMIYFTGADVLYPEKVHSLYDYLHFLLEKMEIEKN